MTIPLQAPDASTADSRTPAPAPRPEGDFDLPPPARIGRTRALGVGVGIIALLAAGFMLRWLPKREAQKALAAETKEAETVTPQVSVVAPTVVSSDRALSLPGSVLPLEETIVYPRASGYVRKWHVDLGDKVKEGDLLADIDTPDLDQQLAQARAQLAQADAGLVQAKANANFSRENLDRYQKLLPAGLASQQDYDKAKAQAEVDKGAVGVAEATIGAQRANLQLLMQLKSFARVTAPFDGTITVRSIERGTLVTAGTATPLFRLAATDPVRVFVQVPQDVAPTVRVGASAQVTIREFPGHVFEGKVAHAAGALDASTRTMNTEVRVPNPKGEIITGMYAQVALTLPTPHRVFSLPSTALLNDAAGLRVAVIGPDSRIRLQHVVIERDTGPTIELAGGIVPEDRVVKLPTPDLTEGRQVEISH